jgi:membrane protease YdiL (CAAX protease family)
VLSGAAFGLAHSIWGLIGRSYRAATAAMLATTALGVGLAVVYLLAARSLAPCVVAHSLIDLLIEPCLMLAAARREMHRSANGVHLRENGV